MKIIVKLLYSVVLSTIILSCTNPGKNKHAQNSEQKLILFHAGSLSVPFKEIVEKFNVKHPKLEILLEAAGSRKCARKITDLNRECDIMASADYTVIDNLLIPDHASWNIKFASNEMTLVYHKESRYANEINQHNWHDILLKEDVAFGRSDPSSDPCGYRAVLTSKLAQTYYGIDGLAEKLLSKDLNYIRPKETDLLGLLESNSIDYIFLYRSVAQQHNLDFLVLPDSINLKSTAHKEFYQCATVDISGQKPGEQIQKVGEPMVYGVTVLNKAPNKEMAMKFVEFLLEEKNGISIMQKNGQPSVIPAYSDTYDQIPEVLKKYSSNSILE